MTGTVEVADRGRTLERFVFRLRYRDRSVTLALREGLVTDEFIELARTEERSAARPAGDVYDASSSSSRS